MPATLINRPDIAAPLTQANVIAGIRDAFTAIGFPAPLKTYTVGTEQFIVWEVVVDSTKTYGKFIYRIRVNNGFGINHAIGTTFVDASNTLNQSSTEVNLVTFLGNQPIKITAFNGPDFKLLLLGQGSLQQFLGYIRPGFAPAFDENSFPKIFIPSVVNFSTCYSTALSPYGATFNYTTLLGLANFSNVDPFTQIRNGLAGVWIWTPNNAGIMAQCSEDLAIGCCVGMARGDDYYDPADNTKRYYVTQGVAGALLIRIS